MAQSPRSGDRSYRCWRRSQQPTHALTCRRLGRRVQCHYRSEPDTPLGRNNMGCRLNRTSSPDHGAIPIECLHDQFTGWLDRGSSRPDPSLRSRERPWHDHFNFNHNSNHNIHHSHNRNIQHVHHSKFHNRTVHMGSPRLPDRIHTCRANGRRGCADCTATSTETAVLTWIRRPPFLLSYDM